MKTGMAEVVITPPVGVRMSGYADRTAGSTGVLDELYARTLVLETGGRLMALVACDLLGLDLPIVTAIRERVSAQCRLPAGQVMITATHTHCGPDLDYLTETEIDELVSRIAGSVTAALAARREATIGFAVGHCATGVSRRNPRSPRTPYHLYSYPEGTMDSRVLVMAVRDAAGAPLGAVLNYACHPVTLGWNELNLSKDYLEYTSAVLKHAWGPASVPLFLQGCAANINPRWVYDHPEEDPILPPVWPEGLDDRLRETARLGRELGGAALSAAESVLRPGDVGRLDSRLIELSLPLRGDMELPTPTAGRRTGGRYPTLETRLAAAHGRLATQLQVLRVGDGWIIGLPGEICVEYQLELRRRIAAEHVLVAELAGDTIDYVTPPELFAEGGYEPGASWVSAEAGALLVTSALKAVQEMGGAVS